MAGELSKAAKRRHIREAGCQQCPFCKVEIDLDTVEYGEPDPIENGDIQQRAERLQCGKKWMDIFRLVDMYELVD